jgi:hypothetical protein
MIFCRAAQVNFVQVEVLEKDLSAAQDAARALCVALDAAQDRFQSGMAVVASRIGLSLAKSPEAAPEKSRKKSRNISPSSSPSASHRHRHAHKEKDKDPTKDQLKNVVNRLREMDAMQNELWEILQENGELIAEFCQVTARLAGVDHQMPPPPPPLLGDLAQNEQVIIRFLEAKLVRFDTEVGLQIDDIELKTD